MKYYNGFSFLTLLMVFLFFKSQDVKSQLKPPLLSNKEQKTLTVRNGGSINLNIGFPEQTIDLIGFGGYFFSNHITTGISNYEEATRWMFTDLNVNIFKITLWANLVEDVNDNCSPYSTNFSGYRFENNGNVAGLITLAKRAKQLNPNIKIEVIALTPPAFTKTNGNAIFGGTIIDYSKMYEEYGEFVVAHLRKLKEEGIEADYIALMNEPDFPSSGVNYDSAEFNPQQAANVYNFTGDYITRELPKYSIKMPEFVGPETISVNSLASYAPLFNPISRITKYTVHQYGGSSEALFRAAANISGNKGLYMSEWHAGHGMGANPDELETALDLASKFNDCFRGGVKGWLYFEGGAPNTNFAGLLFTPWPGTAERKKNYWTFKQYTDQLLDSRYIPTVLNNIANFGNANVCAFTKNNTAVLNVVNLNASAQNGVTLNFGGNIQSIQVYRTSAIENAQLVLTQGNVNQSSYVVNFPGKSFTTVRVSW